ncbi:aldo/keto reductase [Paracoccus sp. Z330]|uniref:Aldo/keto reductase n=1 Tax=Paracoccus onchidii TaxID=3017813 RepID=A0ABT4ZG83_9RHOB|nr:aldo/keto reductase [Paracoccus onchidii]MDB6177690.1 aldo/keto reductase [Paracoccus onchidii]
MNINRIGNTGVAVTDIAFGCSGIGNLYRQISDADAAEVLAAAWGGGIRYFDTAPHYGRGLAEARLGQFLSTKSRDQYVLSTKVGRLLSPGDEMAEADGFVAPLPNDVRYDYSGDGIEAAFAQSCQRLQTDFIDILYVHDIGCYTHGTENRAHMSDLLDSGLDRLQHLKDRGAIGAFGLGVNENQVCLDIMTHRPLDAILLAGRLTLLDRSAEDELVPRCHAMGTSLILGGVFNSGILATGPVAGASYDYGQAPDDVLQEVARLQEQAHGVGLPLPAAALQFARHHSGVASVLIGTAKPVSLMRNLAALELPWTDAARRTFS